MPQPTSTPIPTATPTPLPTETPAPDTLTVSVITSTVTPHVNQPVTLTASVANAPSGFEASYGWELSRGRRLVLARKRLHTHISRRQTRVLVVQGNGELRVRGFGDI